MIKDYCFTSNADCFDFVLITSYFMERLFVFTKPLDAQSICRFSVEILNHAVQLRKKEKFALSDYRKRLIGVCLKDLVLIQAEDCKNYKYLLRQNLESFLD